jgi:hypothetical protein
MLPNPDSDFMGWMRAIGDASWVTTKDAAGLLRMTPGRLCHLRRQGRTPPNVAARLDYRNFLWAREEVASWAQRRAAHRVGANLR